MGVKDFSKTFEYKEIIKLSDLKDKRIAIDAMTEIWRSALGAKSVSTLTDKHGNPTMHINTILSNLVKWHKVGIKTIWVFDHNNNDGDDYHNPAKLQEVIRRRNIRDVAKKKINDAQIKETSMKDIFHDSDDEDNDDNKTNSVVCKNDKVEMLKKQIFCVDKAMIDDVKFILGCLDISYMNAPKGYEGEQIASLLSKYDIVDGVYSGDTDPIPYGAKVAYRYHTKTKKILKYTRDDIIKQINEKITEKKIDNKTVPNNLTLLDFRRICAMLGTDMSKRTKGVGPKSIMKKYHKLELSDEQQLAVDEFSKDYPIEDLDNKLSTPFTNENNIKALIQWLINDKGFNESRMNKLFNKIKN